MTGSRSTSRPPWRAAEGATTAARAPAAAAAAVTAVALTVLGAGPAAAVTQARAAATAGAAASPAKVKYYIVPPPGHGSGPTLYSIAAATLGNGSLFMEIFKLNKGRPQPNGQRLENPRSVETGWILLLPPDASGPGVRSGPLPKAAKATARAAHRPSRHAQASARPATASAPAGSSAAIAETVAGGGLLVFAVAGLGLVLRRRRGAGRPGWAGGEGRRQPTHARTPRPGGDWAGGPATGAPGDGTSPAGPVPAVDGPWPYADHPSWPANTHGRPLNPDHPSWPAGDIGRPVTVGYGRAPGVDGSGWPYPDHPSWPASDAGPPLTSDDYPSWPVTDPSGGRPGRGGPRARPAGPPPGAGLPRRERLGPRPAPAVHHDQTARHPVAQVLPARGRHIRVPAGYARPAAPADDTPQRWSAQRARTTGPIPQTYYDLAFGDDRLQLVLTETPGADGWAGPAATNVLQLTGAGTGQPGAVTWPPRDPGNIDSVRVAQRILADADQQAAEVWLEAAAQAAAIREAAEREAAQIKEQTAAEAAPLREGAEREAAEIKERAAADAAAIRQVAEREVDALRSAARAMSADLDRLAAYITAKFAGPIDRTTGATAPGPPALPGADPAAPTPAGAPSEAPLAPEEAGPYEEVALGARAMPATAPARPGTRPRPASPATRPARRTETPARSRQHRTMRVYAGTIASLVVLALGIGAYQLATRGFTFFVFRSAGTGATDNNAVFPGIIPTPKPSPAHQHPSTGAGHHDARRAHHRRHHPGRSRHHATPRSASAPRR